MDDLAAFGTVVAACRRNQGLTPSELADRSGLHADLIVRVEDGDQDVSLTELVAIARALDTTAADLVERARA